MGAESMWYSAAPESRRTVTSSSRLLSDPLAPVCFTVTTGLSGTTDRAYHESGLVLAA